MANKEAIYRQDVLDLAKKGVLISNGSYKSVCKAINELPPVNLQPCKDSISREWLKNAIHNFYHGLKHTPTEEDIQAYIDAAPPVNLTKTGWIPVSERVPEDSGEYLVTVIDEDVETYKHTGIAWYAHPKDYDVKEGDWRELMIDEKVIAWMPLPKPYEPQESEGTV